MVKPKPRTFVKNIDGVDQFAVAHTPADAVALTFNGWREQVETPAAPAASAPKKAAAAKPAEKPADKPATK
jgi:hypothetical protein